MSYLNNNNRINTNIFSNIRNNSEDNQKDKDIKKIEKFQKFINKEKEPFDLKEFINKNQLSLKKRKENIDKFLMNYRLKNNNSSQSNNKNKNYINFLNSIPSSNSPNFEKEEKMK